MSITGIISHLWSHGSAASKSNENYKAEYGTIYQFKMPDIDGEEFDFASMKGKVLLITNTACGCGFTKAAFEHLVQWQNELKDEPFSAIAFPSNAFDQEKRDDEKIKTHLQEKFGLNFPLMSKTEVLSKEDVNPVYGWLYKTYPGDVTWNFSSYFLINHEGIPIARLEKESWDEMKSLIDDAVKKAKEAGAQ
eukprot:UN00265